MPIKWDTRLNHWLKRGTWGCHSAGWERRREGEVTEATCSQRGVVEWGRTFIPQIFIEYLPEGTKHTETEDTKLARSMTFPRGTHHLGEGLGSCALIL